MISLDKHGRVIHHGFEGAELPQYADQDQLVFGAESFAARALRAGMATKQAARNQAIAKMLARKKHEAEERRARQAQAKAARRARGSAMQRAMANARAQLIAKGAAQPMMGYDFSPLMGHPLAGFDSGSGQLVRQSFYGQATDSDIEEVDAYGNTQLGIGFIKKAVKSVGKGIGKVGKVAFKVAYAPIKASAKIQASVAKTVGKAITTVPILKQIDKYTGGVASGGLKAVEVAGKGLSGQKVTKEELKAGLIGALKVGAVAVTAGGVYALAAKGATAAGSDVAAKAAKKAGLGDIGASVAGAAAGAAAGGAVTGGADLTAAATTAAKDAAVGEAQKKSAILGTAARFGMKGELPSTDELKAQAMAVNPVELAQKRLASVPRQLNISRVAKLSDVKIAPLPDVKESIVERRVDTNAVAAQEAEKVAEVQFKQIQAQEALAAARDPQTAKAAGSEVLKATQEAEKAKIEASVKVAAAAQGRYWPGYEQDHPMLQTGLVS